MKNTLSLRVWIIWLSFFFFKLTAVSLSQNVETLPNNTSSLLHHHSFGFGLEASMGDATLLQILPAFNCSYRYSFSQAWAAQISFSYTGEAVLQRMTTAGQFASMFSEISNSNMGGLTAYYSPNEYWSFGLGAFVRHRSYAYFIAWYPFLKDTWASYLLDYSLGLQISAEYKLTTFSPVEVFLNGHFAYFSPAIAGDAFIGNEDFYNFPANPTIKPTGYPSAVANYFRLPIQSLPFMASIGLCFRVGF